MDAGQFAVAQDLGVGVTAEQLSQQVEHGLLLPWCACVGRVSVLVESAFVADAYGVLVVAFGMCADELFVACLGDVAVTRDIIVVAGEAESFLMAAYECRDGERLVAACG